MLEQDHRLSWSQSFHGKTMGEAVDIAIAYLQTEQVTRIFIEEVTAWGPFSPQMRREAINKTNHSRGVYDVNIKFTKTLW